DISGAIGDYAYEVNAAHGDDARFIALTSAELMSTTSLAKYLPTNLQPASTTISWLAISHSDFIMEAQRLAAYREVALHGSHQTFVADVEDVINQFGYGLPMPSSIHAYLQ
ncbi:MAG: hypothetical protein KAG66_10915, partial [Methylococcales bacterium]|nr:hypothetical protein [Methylococcales bacterium]